MKLSLYIVGLVLAYLVVGIAWSYARWIGFVRGELAYYEKRRKEFTSRFRLRGDEIPEFLRLNWRESVERDGRLSQIPPSLQNHRHRLVLNICLWPLAITAVVAVILYRSVSALIFTTYKRTLDAQLKLVQKDLDKN